jgi:hypothetical protein
VLRPIAIVFASALVVGACSRAPETETAPPDQSKQVLAVYAPQRIVVVPVGAVRVADTTIAWVAQLGGARATARRLDTSIVAVLDARGLSSRWVLPAELRRVYERNRAYAADPYQLVWEPVRSPRFKTGERYGEPLSSQLRTMIALHEDARYVLLPIELRFERARGGVGVAGRGVLRAALVDARLTQALWVGDVHGDFSSDHTAAIASVAAKLIDLFVTS